MREDAILSDYKMGPKREQEILQIDH
jgi:hypothetical protein